MASGTSTADLQYILLIFTNPGSYLLVDTDTVFTLYAYIVILKKLKYDNDYDNNYDKIVYIFK